MVDISITYVSRFFKASELTLYGSLREAEYFKRNRATSIESVSFQLQDMVVPQPTPVPFGPPPPEAIDMSGVIDLSGDSEDEDELTQKCDEFTQLVAMRLASQVWFVPGISKVDNKHKETREHKRAVGFAKKGASVFICSDTFFVTNTSPDSVEFASSQKKIAEVNHGDMLSFVAATRPHDDYPDESFETYRLCIEKRDSTVPAPETVVAPAPETVVAPAPETVVECSICYSLMEYPHMLDGCGHSFCVYCSYKLLTIKHKKCPACRIMFTKAVPNYDLNRLLVPDNTFPRNMVLF